MCRKLTDTQRQSILENAIKLIGSRGIARTTIRDIAEASGVSVGVIYKYYQDKKTLFEACLDHSLKFLSDTILSASAQSTSLADGMERLARVSLKFAEEHPEYIRMYYAITGSSDPEETLISPAALKPFPRMNTMPCWSGRRKPEKSAAMYPREFFLSALTIF